MFPIIQPFMQISNTSALTLRRIAYRVEKRVEEGVLIWWKRGGVNVVEVEKGGGGGGKFFLEKKIV